MSVKLLTASFGILFFSLMANAQTIKVRKEFETKTADDDNPASASFTIPQDKKSSFLINAGIGLDFGATHKVNKSGKAFENTFDGFFVYNQNTQIDSIQHNFKLGITSNQIFFTDAASQFAVLGVNTGEYIRDIVDTTNSLAITSYWHPYSVVRNGIHLGLYRSVPHLITYYFLPQIGLEYQNVFSANSTTEKGYSFRTFIQVGGNLLLKKKSTAFPASKSLWPRALELGVYYTARNAITQNIIKSNNYVPLFQTYLNFYPTQSSDFSFGLSYYNGADPINGITKQAYWQFTVNYKK